MIPDDGEGPSLTPYVPLPVVIIKEYLTYLAFCCSPLFALSLLSHGFALLVRWYIWQIHIIFYFVNVIQPRVR